MRGDPRQHERFDRKRPGEGDDDMGAHTACAPEMRIGFAPFALDADQQTDAECDQDLDNRGVRETARKH